MEVALWQTTITTTRQITTHRILRILRMHRILRTAQTTAQTTALKTIRRTARTAQTTTITTNNLCWNMKRQSLRTGFAFFYLTDAANEYNIDRRKHRFKKKIPEYKDENI